MGQSHWKKDITKGIMFLMVIIVCAPSYTTLSPSVVISESSTPEKTAASQDSFGIQWQKNYGTDSRWSPRYEGPQPIGDADNDGKNEILIGGRDPFLRVLKYNEQLAVYQEQARLIDPVIGLGYTFLLQFGSYEKRINQPFGSATGFAIGDITNDGENEIAVAWGRHLSVFKWNGFRYQKIGMHKIAPRYENGWDTTLDCIIGDCDNDGKNEVVVTGGYSNPAIPEVLVLSWDGKDLCVDSSWDSPGRWNSIYFPWIADVDGDQENELLVGPGNSLMVLDWNGAEFISTTLKTYRNNQVFGCVAKDSNGDNKPEIHVTFGSPDFEIWAYNGTDYELIFNATWPQETSTIEAVDIGDVDNDGIPEVCVGTDDIHIFQYGDTGYVEEYVITDTFGCLAVTAVGDCDNDGRDEIHAGSVWVTQDDDPYMAWIFKFGLTDS